ncbi:MAG: phosphodiester glycosidase family protein [Clostridiaceae bacterium]|nr:phosphodiester glycosidase family protein [Clostridiaceae bacterium]
MKLYGGGGRRVNGKTNGSSALEGEPAKQDTYARDNAGYYLIDDDTEQTTVQSASAPRTLQPQVTARPTPQPRIPQPQSKQPVRPAVQQTNPVNAPRPGQAGYRWVDDEDVVFTSSHEPDGASGAGGAKPPVAPRVRLPERVPEPEMPVKKRRLRWPWRVGIAAVLLIALYLIAVFSPNAFIAKWRTIYIETAMSTKSHQWLATAFIPKSIIDEAVTARYKLDEEQADMVSDKELVKPTDNTTLGALRGTTTATQPTVPAGTTAASSQATTAATATTTTVRDISEWLDPNHPLYLAYPELDIASFNRYALTKGDAMFDADGYLMIDEADRDGKGTTIQTTNGDTVLALDTRNGILLVRVTGDGFNGVLAIVRDPAQVGLVVTKKLWSVGQRIPTLCEDNGAILGINASGFVDDGGTGNGGSPYGYVVSDGEVLSKTESWKVVGFDYDNVLFTGSYKSLDRELRDAAEFKPLLINNGEIVVTVNDGWGINPRTALGQTADGTVLMLVINGRSASSLGCQSIDGARILAKYGAVQASALDGGSSSVMYYNGRVITYPSGSNKTDGRQIPNAFVVYKAK